LNLPEYLDEKWKPPEYKFSLTSIISNKDIGLVVLIITLGVAAIAAFQISKIFSALIALSIPLILVVLIIKERKL
ncbi:MAG: hypothetical protein AB8B92_01805, partial [Gammaproteobacteria bacterium]